MDANSSATIPPGRLAVSLSYAPSAVAEEQRAQHRDQHHRHHQHALGHRRLPDRRACRLDRTDLAASTAGATENTPG